MDDASLPTMQALRCLGFRPDPDVISDDYPGLSFDFGYLKLRASCCVNLSAAQIVLFSGVLSMGRSLGDVHFEMPRSVLSVKHCAAWVAWHLDQFSEFRRAQHNAWIEDGRKNQTLLPWVKQMAEWHARPQCMVKRDWLRLALRTLRSRLGSFPDISSVIFAFDGSVFTIQCDKQIIAFPGEGSPWGVRFRAEAKTLRPLPKRLVGEEIGVSIWESHITLGNHKYQGTVEEFGVIDPSRVH